MAAQALNTPSLAARLYSEARDAAQPTKEAGGSKIGRAADDFFAEMQKAEAVATDAMTGKGDVHALARALAETELAVETAVAVRDKVVEAYQEILRMPV